MNNQVFFCCKCFADERGGSWNESVGEGHCFNCGAGGVTVRIPIWAVDMIRKSASWVGSRYYPNDEDKARYEERKALLALVKKFPGRSAKRTKAGWCVHQKVDAHREVMIFSVAATKKAALEEARFVLPYVPVEKFKE